MADRSTSSSCGLESVDIWGYYLLDIRLAALGVVGSLISRGNLIHVSLPRYPTLESAYSFPPELAPIPTAAPKTRTKATPSCVDLAL